METPSAPSHPLATAGSGALGKLLASDPQSFARQWRRALALRVVGVAVSVTLAQFLAGDPGAARLFAVLAAGIYLPLSCLLYLIQRGDPTPPNLRWFAVTACDIGIIAVTQALFPHLSVAFLGLTAVVMVSAVLVGARWAVYVAGMSCAALMAATLYGHPGQLATFPAVIGGLLLLGMAYLLGTLADDERRTAERARRLAEAMASVRSSLDLTEILDRLCAAARDATNARFTVILVHEGDRLSVGAGSQLPESFPGGDLLLSDVMEDDAHRWSPTARALRSMEPAWVSDMESDEALAPLRGLARRLGFRSLVAVPIERSGEAVGVLNVYFRTARKLDRQDVEFLGALAEHAGVAMERARLYAKERDAAERARELDRLKSEFVATVSHELRTPLTAIVGFGLTLRRRWPDFPPDLRNEFLDRLADNARSLEHLITHLLDFGRLERGEFEIQVRPHDLAESVRAIVDNMVHELSEHPVTVHVPEGIQILTDRYAFDRILGNLLSNAVKFSPRGSAIEIEAVPEGAEVAISVRDHGAGIPDEAMDRLFDLFYRGSQTSRGTGIGLAVVKDLVVLHGGRVDVRTAKPGAVFTVHLPAAARGEDERVVVPERHAADTR